ncbi:MAG: DUF192 domain-containing protein [Patescibacteria group bacterium]
MEIINKIFFSWILIIIFSFFGFLLIKNNSYKSFEINQIYSVKIAGKILKVELALTPEAQERGLSGRKELKEDESMLFIFNHTGKYPFWMRDMNFPIDIIWIGENLRVVYIKKDAKPESYPETFTPNQDVKYVLEVFSSFSEKNNLKEGDKVEFLSS